MLLLTLFSVTSAYVCAQAAGAPLAGASGSPGEMASSDRGQTKLGQVSKNSSLNKFSTQKKSQDFCCNSF